MHPVKSEVELHTKWYHGIINGKTNAFQVDLT